MGNRKRYTAEEKMKILREVLEDRKLVSQSKAVFIASASVFCLVLIAG